MCTDLLIVSQTEDGQNPLVVNGRSQEFSEPLGYRVIFRKQGVDVSVTMPANPGKPLPPEQMLSNQISVKLGISKHNYMGIMMTTLSGTPVSTAVFDGMNSAGLSAGSLNAPGSEYQATEEAAGRDNVFVGFLVDWLLSNFATCGEVKDAFEKDKLRAVAENKGDWSKAEVENNVHQHYAVHDADGKSLVIEFIGGKAILTENPVGVLTNLPVFSWHLTNLGLYAHLSNFGTSQVNFPELTPPNPPIQVTYTSPGSLSPWPPGKASEYRSTGIPGMGDGLAGIPGDFRPASRFVRTAYMKKFAVLPTTENEAVTQAFHLLNGVDIVKGASAEKGEHEGAEAKYDTTQIIMVKDLVNKVFYLRMYESPMPYSIPFTECPHFARDSANRIEGTQITIPTEILAKPLLG